jgi:hypothetical protein
MPPDLPEWKYVDVKADVWAIRHYSKADAANDPTSPLQDHPSAGRPDPDAVGLAFSYDRPRQRATAYYLTHAKDAVTLATGHWSTTMDTSRPTVVETAKGVVRISDPVDHTRAAAAFYFLLMGYLGHAVCT